MELQQLRYFQAVAEEGNFTRAAAKCNVAQPSLSQQLINLEKELGSRLFHRLGRSAVLTENGKQFQERARRILQEVEEATREMAEEATGTRRVRIGVIPTIAPYILPPLIALCRERQPKLEIITYENFKGDLIESLQQGELDLAMMSLPIHDSRLVSEKLFSDPLFLAVGKHHALAHKTGVTIKDLQHENFILLGDSSSLTQQIQRFCGDNDFEPKIGNRCAQVATVKALVSVGVGIAILPRLARSPDDKPDLVYKKLAGRESTRDIGMVRHVQRFQSKGASLFIELLKEFSKTRQEED